MPLDFPSGLNNLIASGHYRICQFVELYLSSGPTLRYGVSEITVDGFTYTSNLKKISGGKISLTESIDRITFTLYNADALSGREMIASRAPLDRVRSVIGTIYINPRDVNEKYRIIEDTGIVNASTATDLETECVFISDTYSDNSVCGDISVEKSCVKIYKGTEQWHGCGYVGDITTCDRSLSGINGCTVHFDFETAKDRFGGHSLFLDNVYVQQVQPKYPEPVADNPSQVRRIPGSGTRFPQRYQRLRILDL